VVERDLAKVEVAGSTPVSRSSGASLPTSQASSRDTGKSQCFKQGRGTQVVRERSAKPLCVGSIPTRASSNSGRFPTVNPQLPLFSA
jgi:hypothetical protein